MTDVNIEGFQLSPQQRHLWRLMREHAAEPPYRSRSVVRIRGPLNADALRAVLDELPARHEILRTTFYAPAEMSTAIQVIAPDAAAPSTRLTLESQSPGDHVMTIDLPALCCDRAGLHNLVKDVVRLYEARIDHTAVPDDVLQYADASIWLNDVLESDDTEAARQFWAHQNLSDSVDARLPFESGPRGPFARRGAAIRHDPAAVAAARASAARLRQPPDAFALGCWQVLLQRTIGTDRILTACLSEGRSYPELQPAIGLFTRCLPLPGQLADETSFADAVHAIAASAADARTWGDGFKPASLPLAFERIDTPAPQLVGDVVFDIVETDVCVDRFTLKLCVRCTEADFGEMWLEYDASRCRDEDATRLAAQFEQLFASAAADPDASVGSLRLLPPAQQREILDIFGAAPAGVIVDLVHRRFEAQAARVPEATAVVCEDASLTYAQLNARANQLAHRLQALGVTADVRVGLCLERSVDIVVGILGILKAGGAYVPLDPQLPPSRIATLVDESKAALIVARRSLAGLLPQSARTISLDNDPDLDAAPITNPAADVVAQNLVYVLFTSGSTGTPKGVAIEHRQLARYVDAVSAALELPPDAAYATVTTFAADLGNTAVYPALTTGGCLHVVTEERASDPNAFADYCQRHPIDVLKIVPSHLTALLSGQRPERVLPRRRLILGGEACPWTLVDRVHQLAPDCIAFNHYGPTETTVGATVFRIDRGAARPPAATVPIGRPLDHARAYVVDSNLEIVPFWVAGELCIGGAAVARGYLGDTDGAARFVRDPWSAQDGARMYRTGDRVRLLPEGVLEFLGRRDNQVKIRGFRVEIGEVETALRRHPSVKEAAVVAQRDGSTLRLVAFVVPASASRPTAADLKTFLHAHGLPDFMHPSTVGCLDALPLTANGKVDRQTLSTSSPTVRDRPDDRQPLTEWESIVADIWRELLETDDIHPQDNFYDLGGHSLLAIQVVSALEKRARIQISPRDLVFHTLKQFAALCESKNTGAGASAATSRSPT